NKLGLAMADLDRVIAIDQDDAVAIVLRGTVFDRMHERPRAVADFDRGIAIYDEWIYVNPVIRAEFFTQRAGAYAAKGDRDRAIADFDQALAISPGKTVVLNNRGLAYNAKGDHDRAILDFDRAIAINPAYAAAFNNRGVAYNAKRDRDRAIADFDEA